MLIEHQSTPIKFYDSRIANMRVIGGKLNLESSTDVQRFINLKLHTKELAQVYKNQIELGLFVNLHPKLIHFSP